MYKQYGSQIYAIYNAYSLLGLCCEIRVEVKASSKSSYYGMVGNWLKHDTHNNYSLKHLTFCIFVSYDSVKILIFKWHYLPLFLTAHNSFLVFSFRPTLPRTNAFYLCYLMWFEKDTLIFLFVSLYRMCNLNKNNVQINSHKWNRTEFKIHLSNHIIVIQIHLYTQTISPAIPSILHLFENQQFMVIPEVKLNNLLIVGMENWVVQWLSIACGVWFDFILLQ